MNLAIGMTVIHIVKQDRGTTKGVRLINKQRHRAIIYKITDKRVHIQIEGSDFCKRVRADSLEPVEGSGA